MNISKVENVMMKVELFSLNRIEFITPTLNMYVTFQNIVIF
jgi:hypothetical protein